MERDPLIGTQLDDYYIQAKLGEGGMAQVYKAYHARLKREVAIHCATCCAMKDALKRTKLSNMLSKWPVPCIMPTSAALCTVM